MKTVKALILERTDLRNNCKLKNRNEITFKDFNFSSISTEEQSKIRNCEVIIFEGVLIQSRY